MEGKVWDVWYPLTNQKVELEDNFNGQLAAKAPWRSWQKSVNDWWWPSKESNERSGVQRSSNKMYMMFLVNQSTDGWCDCTDDARELDDCSFYDSVGRCRNWVNKVNQGEQRLKGHSQKDKDDYDYDLYRLPPSLGHLTMNAFTGQWYSSNPCAMWILRTWRGYPTHEHDHDGSQALQSAIEDWGRSFNDVRCAYELWERSPKTMWLSISVRKYIKTIYSSKRHVYLRHQVTDKDCRLWPISVVLK